MKSWLSGTRAVMGSPRAKKRNSCGVVSQDDQRRPIRRRLRLGLVPIQAELAPALARDDDERTAAHTDARNDPSCPIRLG